MISTFFSRPPLELDALITSVPAKPQRVQGKAEETTGVPWLIKRLPKMVKRHKNPAFVEPFNILKSSLIHRTQEDLRDFEKPPSKPPRTLPASLRTLSLTIKLSSSALFASRGIPPFEFQIAPTCTSGVGIASTLQLFGTTLSDSNISRVSDL